MDFSDRIQEHAKRVVEIRDELNGNEEATKTALVLPFFQALGYDVFNPTVIIPEYTSDTGTKQGEKVDYAVMQDGAPIILVECKSCGDCLDQGKANQLHRYYQNTPSARVGILTDGVVYKFFSDLDQPNIMDPKPFMVVDFSNLDERLVSEVRKLANGKFDVDKALSAAQDLKYTNEIKKIIQTQFDEPDDELVRFFVKKVYSGHARSTVVEAFKPRVVKALREVLGDMVKDKFKIALESQESQEVQQEQEEELAGQSKSGIVTTEEELEGYMIVRAILREVVEPERVAMRDTKSYCGVLLDDNNRKPVCRMHFNGSQKYIGLFNSEKSETRQPIESLSDIYQYSDEIRAVVSCYSE